MPITQQAKRTNVVYVLISSSMNSQQKQFCSCNFNSCDLKKLTVLPLFEMPLLITGILLLVQIPIPVQLNRRVPQILHTKCLYTAFLTKATSDICFHIYIFF